MDSKISHFWAIKTVLAAMVIALSTGCANLPDAKIGYYLPKSEVSFKVVRTIMCDTENHILAASAVTPMVVHSADRSTWNSIPLGYLRGWFSDSDLKFEYYDDGRLKGFNASSTGQGEGILKTAITIAGVVLAFEGGKDTYPMECAEIKKVAGTKPLVLTYEGPIDLELTNDQEIPPESIAETILEAHKLKAAVGYVCARVVDKESPFPRTKYEKNDGDVLLSLREPGLAHVKVTAGGENSCQNETIWDDSITVAQFGAKYDLPLPPSTTFGKRALGATFSESGALTLVQFVSNTGVGQALNVLSAGQAATKDQTTAEKAAAIKAEADLIAQQQRLVQCLADPQTCK